MKTNERQKRGKDSLSLTVYWFVVVVQLLVGGKANIKFNKGSSQSGVSELSIKAGARPKVQVLSCLQKKRQEKRQ